MSFGKFEMCIRDRHNPLYTCRVLPSKRYRENLFQNREAILPCFQYKIQCYGYFSCLFTCTSGILYLFYGLNILVWVQESAANALNTDCKIKPFIVHFTPLNSCNSLPGTGYFSIHFAIVKFPIIFLFQSFYHMVGIFIIRRRNPKFPPHADQRA